MGGPSAPSIISELDAEAGGDEDEDLYAPEDDLITSAVSLSLCYTDVDCRTGLELDRTPPGPGRAEIEAVGEATESCELIVALACAEDAAPGESACRARRSLCPCNVCLFSCVF